MIEVEFGASLKRSQGAEFEPRALSVSRHDLLGDGVVLCECTWSDCSARSTLV